MNIRTFVAKSPTFFENEGWVKCGLSFFENSLFLVGGVFPSLNTLSQIPNTSAKMSSKGCTYLVFMVRGQPIKLLLTVGSYNLQCGKAYLNLFRSARKPGDK